MSAELNLLPCPFCGASADSGNGFAPCESVTYVYCENSTCPLHTVDVGFTAETWNRRTPLPVQAGEGGEVLFIRQKSAPEMRWVETTAEALAVMSSQVRDVFDVRTLYTRPDGTGEQGGQDAEDAARYRFRKQFLESGGSVHFGSFGCQYRMPGQLVSKGATEEEAIDAARATRAKANDGEVKQ
jgi:hypothetical protein